MIVNVLKWQCRISFFAILVLFMVSCRVDMPSDEIIKDQILVMIKKPDKQQLDLMKSGALPFMDNKNIDWYDQRYNEMQYTSFQIIDKQNIKNNGVAMCKVHVKASIHLKDEKFQKKVNQWFLFKKSDKGWVLLGQPTLLEMMSR